MSLASYQTALLRSSILPPIEILPSVTPHRLVHKILEKPTVHTAPNHEIAPFRYAKKYVSPPSKDGEKNHFEVFWVCDHSCFNLRSKSLKAFPIMPFAKGLISSFGAFAFAPFCANPAKPAAALPSRLYLRLNK